MQSNPATIAVRDDGAMHRLRMRHNDLLSSQKKIMIEKQNAQQTLRKSMFDRSPSRLMQKQKLGEQDVAVVVQSSQASPEMNQMQVGIRLTDNADPY
jgi:hypothetical protein